MLTEFAKRLTGAPHPLAPFAPASRRDAWEGLSQPMKEQLTAAAEAVHPCRYPEIQATDYLDFSRTGNRTRYEDRQFGRRLLLDALVLGECVQHQGRFLDDILNGLYAICGEAAWQLPPHNSYIRDTPALPLPDTTRPIVDLFAAETGAVLAAASYLMAKELDEISPFVRTMLADQLERRIFTPYLNAHFWWMGDGTSHMNNWTVWCTQNVLIAAALTPMPQEKLSRILHKACQSIDYFLAEYGEDGCCDEGAQYYRHAGLCLFLCLELLNQMTDNAFAPLWDEPKIKNIAAYIANVHVDGKYYINFSDCSPVAGRCSAREFYFGKRTGQPALMAMAARDWAESEDPLLTQEHNLFYRLQAIFGQQEMSEYLRRPQPPLSPLPELFYPSVGLLIARSPRLCLAVKAGDNGDSHNHNDTGSITLYKDGAPFLIDVGVETYQKKTFSPERYEIWTMQSQFHNLPTFLGAAPDDAVLHPFSYVSDFAGTGLTGSMECDGEEYRAAQVTRRSLPHESEISMELAGAYPDSRLQSFRRRVLLRRQEELVVVEDQARCPGLTPVLSLMTYEEPRWDEASQRLWIGELGFCQVAGASQVCCQVIPITDARLQTAWKHDLWRTLITWAGDRLTLRIQ